MSVILSGFTDEVSRSLEKQIEVTRTLGWGALDLRTVDGGNIAEIDDQEFARLKGRIEEAGLKVSSFGSTLANWGRTVETPLKEELATLRVGAKRMRELDTRFVRVMSYRMPRNGPVGTFPELESEILRRMRSFAEVAEAEGVICLHENCETWGGQSIEHTVRILDAVKSPAFGLVFDTGNPPGLPDVRGEQPYSRQNALEFYNAVKDRVLQVHIKDGVWRGEELEYTNPGEGEGRVPEILAALAKDGYDGFISIEPHTAMVFHDPSKKADPEERWRAYVDYGHATEKLVRAAGMKSDQ